ncbi:MAG: hypothetical protein J0H01_35965 [Rhizobiales bacterium]|nr:hypothetical protein [Hyphomicrobiales bacterium]
MMAAYVFWPAANAPGRSVYPIVYSRIFSTTAHCHAATPGVEATNPWAETAWKMAAERSVGRKGACLRSLHAGTIWPTAERDRIKSSDFASFLTLLGDVSGSSSSLEKF